MERSRASARSPARAALSAFALAVALGAAPGADPPASAVPSVPASPSSAPAGAAGAPPPGSSPVAWQPAGPFCSGEYADDLAALSAQARAFELSQPSSTFCIRTSAVYECPFYASDGMLRRRRIRVVAHGTGFAYRRDGQETLLVTNEHVADWPAVTDEEHAVTDVPSGCRRVADALKIVHDEADAYARDDIPLTRVVADPALDIAVLRAKVPLAVVPWKIGHSAALRERNAIEVHGFPLGAMRATNAGKVTAAFQHDGDREWDHDDFVVDALLSPGNSGSPVFAVSCRTGEFELVGVYHAGYTRGSALNVVVGIDQVRPMLDTLKRTPRRQADSAASLDVGARERITAALAGGAEPFFPFGPTSAAVRARPDGALVFEVMGRDFPAKPQPALVMEDLPSASGTDFGRLGTVWVGNGYGLHALERSSLDADAQAQISRLLDALRRDALLAASYRTKVRMGVATRERFDDVARLERSLRRLAETRRDLAQTTLDLAERLCPPDVDATVTLADVLAPPARPSPGPAAAAAGPVEPAVLAPVSAAQPPATAPPTPSR